MIEVEVIATIQVLESKPTYRRWVGVATSFLIPGAGIYLSGEKSGGIRWFCGLVALGLATEFLTPQPAIPGIAAFLFATGSYLVLTGWMLVRSFRPIPKMRVGSWLAFVALACGLGATEWLVGQKGTRAFRLQTGSMSPTLVAGDRAFVQPLAYRSAAPTRGDIVVFRTDFVASLPPGQCWGKRVAALPGEELAIRSGRLVVNGKALATPAILAGDNFKPPMGGLFPDGTNSLVVPDDSFFVVGDNATNSLDSRHFGPIPRRSIVGKLTKIYWPPSRIGNVQ